MKTRIHIPEATGAAITKELLLKEECVASPFATNNYNLFVKSYVKNYPEGTFSNEGLKYVEIVK